MPSPRKHEHSVDSNDDCSDAPRAYRPRIYRDDSLVTRDEPDPDRLDSAWDPEYSPKDKYYLSESDHAHDLDSPRRSSPSRHGRAREHSRERRRPAAHDQPATHHWPSRKSPSSPGSHSRRHGRHRSPSPSRVRDEPSRESTARHKPSTHAKSASASSQAPRARPKASQAGSCHLPAAGPRAARAASSSSRASRPRPGPVRGLSSRNASSHTTTKTTLPRDLTKLVDPDTLRGLMKDFPWDEAGKVALQAGTVAAIKVGTDSMPWAVKATKIGSAALGAAVVDHVFRPQKKGGVKYAVMRHLAELVVGNLVVGPAMGKADTRVTRRSGGGKR